eukprot:gene4798-9567_t
MGAIFLPLCILIGVVVSKDYHKIANDGDDVPIVILSMNSPGYKYFLVSEMTVATMMLLDAAIDNLSNDFHNIFSSKGSLVNICLLISTVLGSSINFFVCIHNEDYVLLNTVLGSRLIFINCAIFSYAYRYGHQIWRSRVLIITSLTGCLGILLKVISLAMNKHFNYHDKQIDLISVVLSVIFRLVFMLLCFRWYWYLKQESKSRQITSDEWNCTIYITLGLLLTIILWIYGIITNSTTIINFSVPFLIGIEVVLTLFVVCQAMHQTRILRKESIQSKTVRVQIQKT